MKSKSIIERTIRFFSWILRKESIWMMFLIIILYFFSYAPIVRNFIDAPKDRYYWGSVDYPIDQVGNLIYIREGYLGHWQRFSKITSTIEGVSSLIRIEHVLIGQMARVAHLDPLIMYHISKVAISLATLLFIYFFITRVYKTKIERIVGFLFALFATSITLPADWSRKISSDLPFDVYVFFRLTTSSHHYLLGILFSLVSLYYLAKAIDGNSGITYFLTAAIFGMFAGLVYTPSAVLLILSLPIFWFIRLSRRYLIRDKVKDLFYLLIYIAILAIPIIYYRYISQYWDMNTLSKTEKIVPFNPLPWHYFYLVGITYFLSLVSIPYVLKRGNTILLMLIPWVVVHPAAVYLLAPLVGINKTRFFMTPHFVVFGILAVSGINYITETMSKNIFLKFGGVFKAKVQNFSIFAIASILVVASGLLTYKISSDALHVCFCQAENFSFGYPKKEVMEAIFWLRDNTKEEDVVLSGLYAGVLIPAFAGNKVYTSWWHRLVEPPNFWENYQDWTRFYSGAVSNEEALQFLKSQKIAYVFFGHEEQELARGETTSNVAEAGLSYPFLEERIRSNKTVVYGVK